MTINNYAINGTIDTSNNVFDNIELLAISSGCYVTWDSAEGKWSIIINQAGSSIFSFNDANILGSISVGVAGLNDLYNSVEIQYPHKDLRDVVDYLTVSVDSADRYANELDNALQISLSTVNEPIQAQYIATQELKQNRIDKVIEFNTDFTANGLKAGDLIDVTNAAIDFNAKVFRIIQITEEDSDEGAITYAITAAEYSTEVYNISGLTYDLRTKNTGIPSKIVNEEIEASDDEDSGASIGRLLLANAAAKMFNSLLGSLFGDPTAEGALTADEVKDAQDQADFLSGAKKPPLTHSASTTAICEGGTVTINFTDDCETCYFDVPDYEYPYTITGIDASDISIPLEGTVSIAGKTGSISFDATVDGDANETLVFACGENTSSVVIQAPGAYTYDTITAVPASITEGDSVTITVTATGIADGTTKPYSLSGSAMPVASKSQSSPLTFNGGTASLTVTTVNDSEYTGGETLTFEIEPGYENPCALVDARTVTVNVADDETAPLPDNTCETVSVPVAWCGSYDATTNYLTSLSAVRYMTFALASTGGTAVPSAVSVTSPGQSGAAIVVDSTVNVDTTSGQSGTDVNVITSFATPSQYPATRITGTTATLRGY